MKVSVFTRPEYLIAAAYLAAHLPSLAPSLEDIDSLNFALGLRDFEPALHQPHPPGYPIYIALGRASLALVSRAAPSLDRLAAEAFALAICRRGLRARDLVRHRRRRRHRRGGGLFQSIGLGVSAVRWCERRFRHCPTRPSGMGGGVDGGVPAVLAVGSAAVE
jgi:hypothetical protein